MNLETLQREMAAAIMLPLTPDEDMRAVGAGWTQDGRCGSIFHCAEQQAERL